MRYLFSGRSASPLLTRRHRSDRPLAAIGGLARAGELAWLDSYRAELDDQHYGGLIREVIVFGSKARGDADQDSDLDLLVIIEDGDWRVKWDIADVAYGLALGTDVVPSVPVYTAGEWKRLARRRSVFRDAVERDGVPVG